MMTGIQAAKTLGLGGPAILAKACKVSRQTIYNWQAIPAEHVLTIEKLIRVPREQIRPDIYVTKQRRPRSIKEVTPKRAFLSIVSR